uniref:7TM GPCR serpentine receptor class x (Srx) domain-containing protein n=1 Tax=Parascaris equorum TaxID=6256 RepID=A0A914R4N5_PAREQ
MISNSIGQIAVLYASTLNANRIYFGGYFIRNHPIVMRTMTFAVNFWSVRALMLLNLLCRN